MTDRSRPAEEHIWQTSSRTSFDSTAITHLFLGSRMASPRKGLLLGSDRIKKARRWAVL
jgi:hypothetical protein